MAMDGSFNLQSSFNRFLARCPELSHRPRFDYLAKKGELITEEEVISLLGDVFVHPDYNIPLIGCFRPLSQKIVKKVVSLLRLVPNLRSNSESSHVEVDEKKIFEDIDGSDCNLMESFVRNGRGLNLHELACLAFCRAVDLAPFLMGSVLDYFKFAPTPFERIMKKDTDFELPIKGEDEFLRALRISYRMLLMSPKIVSKLWDWSCFLDLARKFMDVPIHAELEYDIRWCTTQIIRVIFKLTNTDSMNLGIQPKEAFGCLMRWQEFCCDVCLEKAGLHITSPEGIKSGGVVQFSQNDFVESSPVYSRALSRFSDQPSPLSQRNEMSVNTPFVLTLAVRRSFEMILLAASQKWPVLLYGPPGVGKSALIKKLAHDSGNNVLSIHMDDQIDGKTLVGSYICADQPGEFKWQPGSLTQAVMNGYWVVLEDIDKAPADVHSIILPLLEGANSFLTGHGEELRVADSFRLFSTVSTSRLHTGGSNDPGNLWRRVMIGQSSHKDLEDIVTTWFPNLESLANKLIETFERINFVTGQHWIGDNAVSSSSGRFSLRDLLKWCKRIVGFGFDLMEGSLSTYVCHCIYQEAVDIFAAFSMITESRLALKKEIAKIWAVPVSEAETLYPVHKPVIQDLPSELKVGRISLPRARALLRDQKKPFVEIRRSLHAIERIACSVKHNEPVLLVGETGTGKTTLVQNLALRLGQRLTVLNLSQQSDIADLLGGFKPMNAQYVCIPLYEEFEDLFSKTFSVKVNADFLVCLRKHLSDKNWKVLLNGVDKGVKFFHKTMEAGVCKPGRKRKKTANEETIEAWEKLSLKLKVVRRQIGSGGMIFSFVEGAIVNALRKGEWILLDEVNLAPPEILQRVTGVLEGDQGSLCLAERGDASYIQRHPDFRIFACMNPATDAGKRELPYSVRSRFTEYFIDDALDDDDLALFINCFVDDSPAKAELVKRIMSFYKAARDSEQGLQDGANQKPQYSLRSLFRALEFTRKARQSFKFEKALYDGFCMFFLNLLDRPSAKLMNQKILSVLLGGIQEKMLPNLPFDSYITIGANNGTDDFVENYVLTKSVLEQLKNVARAVFIKKYPVLLQGPTSSGKTSLVRYLATVTGHEFVRINNHEHTDLQEYLGSYITDASGKLVFNEGALVRAVRNGSWIVLDELNLAPSDVLEALNRLLDDNREIFVPELQETIRAHPDFMLFATQNPPTVYGGRKMLSRAFRNRFVEIHVDEIPEEELSSILENRCKISGTYAKKMVEVMKDLQLHRQNSNVFAGKHGFITPRDLFRWANRVREANSDGLSSAKKHRYEDLAKEGYYLLAERLRDEGEKNVVKKVLLRHFQVPLDEDIYWQESSDINPAINFDNTEDSESLRNIVWTRSMWRLYFLIKRCYKMREPVLLVGETGGGKTTVCQMLSIVLKSKLHILNCHQYTETSDFIGGFYPVRERSRLVSEFKALVEDLMLAKAFVNYPESLSISYDIGQASSTVDQLSKIIDGYRKGLVSSPEVTLQELDSFEQRKKSLEQVQQRWQSIFTWQDGSLVQAMKAGHMFLVDEISLADDSVLERLNSVLEPERTLTLPEKGGPAMEKIVAHENFFILATMNPGGDYGKKELSPALRNRFTEIWVPPIADVNELRSIAMQSVSNQELSYVVDPIAKFWEWFNNLETGRALTVRDILSWVTFVNTMEGILGAHYSLFHGLFLTLLDGLGLGTGISKSDAEELKERSLKFLENLVGGNNSLDYLHLSRMENYGWDDPKSAVAVPVDDVPRYDNLFGLHPFYIEKGNGNCEAGGFELLAPTTRRNALRVLRAMQLKKPVLLEGSPGVGKTSLVVALGKFSGHKVVRINLSEQTDMMDLLGSDLPVDSDEGIAFAWSDGILLQALKEGCWVLLDELNLAPQSVLEGLNAILDHRAEVFIPELGHTYRCPPSFRVFACQNPSSQGGGRKGLPKSFLNRFTKVYVDELVEDDYLTICSSLYSSIPRPLLSKLISFNKRVFEETMLLRKFAQDGSPWEFNLRDVIRSCQIITDAPESSKVDCFLNLLYVQRMRTAADRRQVVLLYRQVFEKEPYINPFPRVQLTSEYLIVGSTSIKRNNTSSFSVSDSELKILPGIRQNLEAAASCVKNQWLCILIGPSSSGKTSLIRILSHLTCNVLHELNLSSATDISELLGCFEQYSVFRHLRSVITQIDHYVSEYCRLHLEHSVREFIDEKKDLISKWNSFLASFNVDDVSGTSSMLMSNWGSVAGSFNLLIEIVMQLKLVIDGNVIPVSWSLEEVDKIMSRILKLQEHHKRTPFSAKFEWVTGLLVRAIEKGEWIVLEDANLCNPTVLDRINSLVEMHGSITVNECGIIDGKPVVLHPHPNFRMFLTVNPCYGEVSRAMRNRGVEIYMMQPFWQFEGKEYEIAEMELNDVKRFLIQSGIPGDDLVNSMARAHMYARDEGLHSNVSISYLELARWVQLFQRLATSGNSLLWSLRVSWEHTYLSSFGYMEGEAVIAHAINTYLSENAFCKSVSLVSPLCLPGGWPTPLKLLDFNLYPEAASIRQNCLYLEFLGARCALYEVQKNGLTQPILLAQSKEPLVQNRFLVDKQFTTGSHAMAYRMDRELLQPIIFPKDTMLQHSRGTHIDLALANKMLLFAADWSIEQATYTDLDLYLVWFNWFSSQLAPFCEIFCSFLASLKKELNHPIWRYIMRVMLKYYYQVHMDLQRRPMLSSEMVDLVASNENAENRGIFFHNAVNCVGLLRRSNRQWNAEESGLCDNYQNLQPLLNSLRVLEEQVLAMLVESAKFDHLFKLYNHLLEDHIDFWDSITSSQFDRWLIFWRALIKDAKKLVPFCPQAASTLTILEESRNVVGISSWRLSSEKSFLWVNGGHPSLPPAGDIYYRQLDFFKLCDSIWPPRADLWRNCNGRGVELISMLSTELRDLAVQGIGIASHLSGPSINDHGVIVQRLEEMHQMLKERFEYEKRRVETHLSCKEDMVIEADLPSLSQMLCSGSEFASWLEILYLNDCTSFYLDTDILQNVSSLILLDPDEFREAFSSISHLVKFSLDYSLNSSLRPPQMFSAYQNLLWILDAWTSLDQVNARIAAFVLEMWFRWHSSLWDLCHSSLQKALKPEGFDASLPDIMFQPMKTTLTLQIQQSLCNIKDYSAYCLKLRVASSHIWQASAPKTTLSDFLLSAARALLQQIIYAHCQSFDAETFIEVKSIFSSLHENTDTAAGIAILRLRSLILLSSHEALRNSLPSFIEPALRELYLRCLPNGFSYNIGLAWLHIGSLRYHLLRNCDDLDPALKYSCKKLQLERRCSLLELEIKVRQECDYLAGWFSAREPDKRRQKLETLKSQCNKIERKMVFRADLKKFKKLKAEIDDFAKHPLMLSMVNNTTALPPDACKICDWEKTATSFIERLAVEYAEYVDIIQPIQVALFEMKLGLSLVLSSILEEGVSDPLVEEDMERIMEVIYSFMRFPRSGPRKLVDVNCSCISLEVSTYDVKMSGIFSSSDVKLLEELAQKSAQSEDESVSESQLKLSVHHNILIQTAHFVGNTQAMSWESFALLDETFDAFSKLWLDMKIQTKAREDSASQQFIFKPRGFEMENVIEVNISTLGGSSAIDSFMEWQKLEAGEESTERIKTADAGDSAEGFWDIMQDPVAVSIVHIHNQLFGSSNLVLPPKAFEELDVNKLQSFIESYKLGAGMIKGFWSLYSSGMDSRLMPEHLLHLCLNHQQNSSHTSALGYNFYKHSNASVLSQMVKFLVSLERHVLSLLSEWEDHPDLQKILDVIRMLLAIPPDTPLAKALSGLQFLINKVREIQESGSKFSLSDQLEPIVGLAASWHKLESESWLTLLEEVQYEYEKNAARLWFPLGVVLNRPAVTTGNSEHDQSTLQSLVGFIQTSNIGEFRKRLQLLLAFAGQISCGLQLGYYSSPHHKENLKILCNSFGFYLQFLPIILEHVENNRKNIEKEIRELTKLCKWQRVESYLPMENTRRFRQKLKKLVQKYSDVLEQPVIAVLNQKSAQNGLNSHSLLSPKFFCLFAAGNEKMKLELSESYISDRFVRYANWRKKASEVAENLQPLAEYVELPCLKVSEEVKGTMRRCSVAGSSRPWYQGEWEEIWSALGSTCANIVGCGELWEKGDGVGKKTALSNLLKLLESHGLPKRMPAPMKDQNQSSWLLQPAHNMWHLLPMLAGAASVSSPCKSNCSLYDTMDAEWKIACEYYYKSMVSMELLTQIRLTVCTDCRHFTLEQISRSESFLFHLLVLQQEQRDSLYDLAAHLKHLHKCTVSLYNLYSDTTSECVIAENQHMTLQCLWQQKQLFDSLWATLHDGCLLLKQVESTAYRSVLNEVNRTFDFFVMLIPKIQKAKEALDDYLLDCDDYITILNKSLYGRVISSAMKGKAYQNFDVLKEFKECVAAFRNENVGRSLVRETLLDNLDDIVKKGEMVLEQYKSSFQKHREATTYSRSEVEAEYHAAFKVAAGHALHAVQKLASLDGHSISDQSCRNMTSWKILLNSCMADLKLKELSDNTLKIICLAEKLVNHVGMENPGICVQIGASFREYHSMLMLILDFGNGLLKDLLSFHKMISIMTHTLGENLSLFFSKGYGTAVEEQLDDHGNGTPQTANGTGLGTGAGIKDVSDQIENEDQLGNDDKLDLEQDAGSELPSKNEKGIEMEQDFAADMFSVSEDSGEDDDDNGNEESDAEQIESAMGEAGGDSEVIDEKLWNKNESQDSENTNEKYESGPSVKDNDDDNREFRAKEEDATKCEEPETVSDGSDVLNDANGNQDDIGDQDGTEKIGMDKEEAHTDPTGLEPSQCNQVPEEDAKMTNEGEDTDAMEEDGGLSDNDGFADGNQEDGIQNTDENMEEADIKESPEDPDRDDFDWASKDNVETDLTTEKDKIKQSGSSSSSDHVPAPESETKLKGDSGHSDSVNNIPEANWSSSGNAENDLAPLSGQPSSTLPSAEFMVLDSTYDGKLADHGPKPQSSLPDASPFQKAQPNPYRSIGDALEGWKERIKLSIDMPEDKDDENPEIDDENADEYGYVTEREKGTAQALGPATSEQIDHQFNSENFESASPARVNTEELTEMETDSPNQEAQWASSSSRLSKDGPVEPKTVKNLEKSPDDGAPRSQDLHENHPGEQLESLIHVSGSSASYETLQLSRMSIRNDDPVDALEHQDVSANAKDNAASLWRKYELRTMRLSQELAERLRLVLEPTLASKLQGDYKTGKRINMKKVIPYIASHYRKDKIWLRRTRPDKRDYEVVIVIDDSRSMSDSGCGNAAVEALVTVCRALSQLEMGNLAIVSFGKMGNLRLLHDFDRPFTREAGIEIISSLTFMQENSIKGEPVVELLEYLKKMLDVSVSKARLPSGHNPLQQLVLIIADGRLNEKKERLKARIRDILNSKRMVAFLILDSHENSIMDMLESSGQGMNMKFFKYMDSFPFPYYIVLKDIEALPRTLSDLLRQWFELMQNTRG